MSDLSGAPSKKDSIYADMQTDVLKEMLRYSAFSDEALDYESTLVILNELKKREPGKLLQTPEEALRVFQAEYSGNESAYIACAFDDGTQTNPHPKDEKEKNHLSGGVDEVVEAHNTTQAKNHVKTRGKSHKRVRTRRIIVIAAAFALAALILSTTAAGSWIWNALVQWRQESFSFVDEITPVQISDELAGLFTVLEDYGITENIAPTWLPEGFALTDSSVLETRMGVLFAYCFANDEKDLVIQISVLKNPTSVLYERSHEDSELYMYNGTEHYIVTNEGRLRVAWKNINCECSVVGDITSYDAKKIINSIYER